MKRRILTLLAVLCILGLGACASRPDADIAAANESLGAARVAEAESYAPDEYAKASDSLKEAQAEISVQEDKFALTRSYDKAVEILSRAKQEAQQAAEAASANREKVKAEVESTQARISTLLSETRDMLDSAPKGKGTKADLEALAADLAAAEGSLGAASQSVSDGKFLQARDELEAVSAKITSIRTEIENAVAARKRR